MCRQMIVVVDGVLEKEVAKIRGSDQSGAVGLKPRDGLAQTKNMHGIATEVRSTNLRFFHDNNRSGQHSRSDGLDGPKIRARQLSRERRNQGHKGFHSSRIVVTHYQKLTLQVTISVRARVDHGC